ncbi:MAG: hypothetical protein ACRC2Q_09685, partial [Cetobacterium sp.]
MGEQTTPREESFVSSGVEISNLNGKVLFKDGILTLSGNSLKILASGLEYKKDLTYNVNLDLNGEDLKFDVISNFINLNGEYKKKDEILNLYQDKKLVMSYNLKTQTLELLDLAGSSLLNNYDFFLKAREKDKIINFEEISMVNKDGQMVLQIIGDLNRENLKYKFKIHTKNFQEKSLFANLNLDTKLDFIGEIAGEKDKFILRGVINDLKAENKDILLDAYANISVVNDNGLQANIQGELREGKYKKIKVQGIKIDSTFDNGKLMISDVRNKLFKVQGEVNVFDKTLDLGYHITGLKSSEFEKTDIILLLENVYGNITGTFEEFQADAQVKAAYLEMPNKALISMNGNIVYEDDTVKIDNFKLNQSLATVEYNLKEKTGKFILNILEENLSKYYNFKALKYRILSRVNGKISNGVIEADAGVNIDRVY